jgi:nucleolar protein 12
MHRLVQEEARENEIRRNGKTDKRQKKQSSAVGGDSSSSVRVSEPERAQSHTGHGERSSDIETPQHESLATSKATKEDPELEKASRTIFLANVSTLAIKSKTAKKTLLDHLASFLASLPEEDTLHKVDSLRFRSTAFSSTGVPKKTAYAKKELMDSTTKSTNAYAVYSTQLAAREATKKLNGTVVLDRHLRVDSVAHPAKQDHRRCVFVGNLGFVDDMSTIDAAEDEENHKRPRKAKEPADIEEGLWRQFGKAGTLESVRVVRDKTTRVGKGFAYVQFQVC